jgi:NADP-dependent 3-hydroxy acid dehydrogenase YdfG
MVERTRIAWIVGGGTGIGRAAAQALAGDGFHVVVSGRRAAELDETLDAIHQSGGAASALVLDVTDDDAVRDAAARLVDAHGRIDALVYCAGTNVARRFWNEVSATDIAHVMDVNLQGAVRTVHAVLPGMRAAGTGLVVLISSWAAWRHSPGAGAAYAMSKTALGVMAETLNAQERLHGIRATHLCPGEVATDILDTRPNPPSAEARALMLTPGDVGEAVAWVARQPARVCVNELVLTPTANTSYA